MDAEEGKLSDNMFELIKTKKGEGKNRGELRQMSRANQFRGAGKPDANVNADDTSNLVGALSSSANDSCLSFLTSTAAHSLDAGLLTSTKSNKPLESFSGTKSSALARKKKSAGHGSPTVKAKLKPNAKDRARANAKGHMTTRSPETVLGWAEAGMLSLPKPARAEVRSAQSD